MKLPENGQPALFSANSQPSHPSHRSRISLLTLSTSQSQLEPDLHLIDGSLSLSRMGFNSLSESAGSSSITEASPFARPETVQLTSQALDDAGERIVGNPHRKSAVPANVQVELSQEN